MSRAGKRTTLAALAVVGALLLVPAAQASAGDGPVATKSGAIVNYTSTAKVKIKKKMFIYFACNIDCSLTSTTKIKGPGGHITVSASGVLTAGVQGFLRITPNGNLLKLLKANPGKFRLVNTIVATDPTTGAQDKIQHSFKLKR